MDSFVSPSQGKAMKALKFPDLDVRMQSTAVTMRSGQKVK
jgi:hypothetical protein